MPTVDYLPIATGPDAVVDSQATFVASTYQANGVAVGTAQPSNANKMWRQSSVISSAIATFLSETLNVDVLDDGNVSNLVALLGEAVAAATSGAVLTQPTQLVGDNSTKLANTAFVQQAIAALKAAYPAVFV